MGQRRYDRASAVSWRGSTAMPRRLNNRGQIVGWAENGVVDPTCNTALQTLQFRAVIWETGWDNEGNCPPLPGDSTSAATSINDLGQVVGISRGLWNRGSEVSVPPILFSGKTAFLPKIPNLGGHTWNTPTAINNQGTVVGFLAAGRTGRYTKLRSLPLDPRAGGLVRLGKLPGDIRAEALGVK